MQKLWLSAYLLSLVSQFIQHCSPHLSFPCSCVIMKTMSRSVRCKGSLKLGEMHHFWVVFWTVSRMKEVERKKLNSTFAALLKCVRIHTLHFFVGCKLEQIALWDEFFSFCQICKARMEGFYYRIRKLTLWLLGSENLPFDFLFMLTYLPCLLVSTAYKEVGYEYLKFWWGKIL